MTAPHHSVPINRRQGGFTLLELSIVLGILALIAGAGLSMAAGALRAADRVTTEERLNTIKFALDSYAATYGYLPCPANRTLAATTSNFGMEERSGATCTATPPGTVASGNVWIGAVPVRTLGLPDPYASDAWGNKLTYATSDALTGNGPASIATQNGNLLLRYGDRTTSNIVSAVRNDLTGGAASSNAGKLRVTFASTSPLTTSDLVYIASANYKGSFTPGAVTATTVDFPTITWVANDGAVRLTWQTLGAGMGYAVISHGRDGLGAFPANGATIPAAKTCSATATDGENCNDDAVFFDTAYNDGTQGALFFDDYIVTGSNDARRAPFNNALYTSGTATTCPAGTCETWCAACTLNYPGAGTAVPPAGITSGAVLCRKVVSSATALCSATCFWGGTTASGYVRC